MENQALNNLKGYWPIVVSIITVVTTFVTLQNGVAQNTSDIAKLQKSMAEQQAITNARLDKFDATSVEIQVKLAEISTDVKYIKKIIQK